ncbi:Cof-type HAD-IIB family hydrolase [Hespellia stercorisuis]|uniref:Haloacid dehalogenase-like hydrolase n=1 Tax=Hespellia stercorisuis DSM 15480 TaxID=1121950 RepID=A0A1M6QM59_9FIRM|nr:Cof-type HAD-IIB family hydrolase [Hespellia stercorisuis]SHK21258.1 hypothetical protein SAMN02745243_02465 [Hespellia stercorisuis DSM 15480]
MNYQIIVLDLDGTLTNSRKEITAPTEKALMEIQQNGKRVVLASGRPINGIVNLADQLDLHKYNGYILSFNGGRITNCTTGEIIYNRAVPAETIPTVYDIIHEYPGLDILSYSDDEIISGIQINEYTELESRINHMNIRCVDNFKEYVNFPVNKLLVTGDPAIIKLAMAALKKRFHSYLNIYNSSDFFIEVMPSKIDKAYSLQKLLSSIGLTADEMICCGDGYNDVTMLEYAGLGVAMENANSDIKESADFVTKSNDDDGILHVINQFMR